MKKKEVVQEEELEEYEETTVPEYYILKIGETLKDVAKKFGLKEEKLQKLNGEVIGTNQIKLK